MRTLPLFILLLIFISCQKPNNTEAVRRAPSGNPALKDYVKTPLDKAKLADKISQKHDRKMAEQIEELDQ